MPTVPSTLRVTELKSLDTEAASVSIRAGGLTPEALEGLKRWTPEVRMDGDRLTLALVSEAAMPEITRYLVACGADVYAITPQRLALEDLFIQTVGKDGGL